MAYDLSPSASDIVPIYIYIYILYTHWVVILINVTLGVILEIALTTDGGI